MDTTIHEGGCLCGRVRYQVTGRPLVATVCHCGQCRKAAGAPFVAWAEFPAQAVAISRGKVAWFGSSDAAERGFCRHCGTALSFTFIDGDTIDISTATLDDPNAFPPQDHIWTEFKVGWVELPQGVPAYPRSRPT